jgi:hypothetical protein
MYRVGAFREDRIDVMFVLVTRLTGWHEGLHRHGTGCWFDAGGGPAVVFCCADLKSSLRAR